jgi:hypothetical protein
MAETVAEIPSRPGSELLFAGVEARHDEGGGGDEYADTQKSLVSLLSGRVRALMASANLWR